MKLEFEPIPQKNGARCRDCIHCLDAYLKAPKTRDHTSSTSCIEPCVLASPYLAVPLGLLQYCVAILMYGKSEPSVWLRLANGKAKEFAHERSFGLRNTVWGSL
jgi:hypothetical protein